MPLRKTYPWTDVAGRLTGAEWLMLGVSAGALCGAVVLLVRVIQ